MILLQVEATGIFSTIAQQGIAFAILVAIIIVLGRRVIKLEKKIEELTDDKFEYVKENTLILKEATESMKEMSKTRCNYGDN